MRCFAFCFTLCCFLMPGYAQDPAEILKSADERLSERIKWNAPSYHLDGVDIVTFGPLRRKKDEILLVFHHPKVVDVSSAILEGDFRNRRLVTLRTMTEVEDKAAELIRVVQEILW